MQTFAVCKGAIADQGNIDSSLKDHRAQQIIIFKSTVSNGDQTGVQFVVFIPLEGNLSNTLAANKGRIADI